MFLRQSDQKLESALRSLSQISVPEDKKSAIKKNIVEFTKSHEPAEEFGFSLLISRIKHFAEQVSPREYFRVLLKEKLITLSEFQPRYVFSFRWLLSKRITAAVISVVFVFTALFSFTYNTGRVAASYITAIKEAQGEVVILRGDGAFFAQEGMILKSDDVVRTGAGSQAVIAFLDQSISRLDENTEIKISKLFVNPADRTQTIVELVLNQGRLWNRVVNLVNNVSRFQVKAENTIAVAKKKAAFDVAVTPKQKAKVSAVQNKVDLVVATNRRVVETALIKGAVAEVKTNAQAAAPKIVSDQDLEQTDEWVSSNLQKDKQYIEEIKQEAVDQIKEGIKVLPGNPLYAVKEISETTKIAFALNETDKQRKILEAARAKFAEAEVLLEKGDKQAADNAISAFREHIKGMSEWVKNNEAANPAEAGDLRATLEETMNAYQKQFTLVLPAEPLYALKEAVSQMQVEIAANEVQKTETKLTQASDKLMEAHDLAEQGDAKAAKEQLQEYSQKISEVVSEVQQMPADTKEKAVSALIDTKAEDLKMLDVISKSARPAPEQNKNTGTTTLTQPIVQQNMQGQQDSFSSAQDFQTQQQTPSVSAGTSVIDLTQASTSTPAAVSLQTAPASNATTTKETVLPLLEAQNAVSAVPQPLPTATVSQTSSASEREDLKKAVSEVKTETLTNLGVAVLGARQEAPSAEVLKKIEEIKNTDINGKQMVNVTVTQNKVLIRTSTEVISVSGSSTIMRNAAPFAAGQSAQTGSTTASQGGAAPAVSQITPSAAPANQANLQPPPAAAVPSAGAPATPQTSSSKIPESPRRQP